MPARLLDEIQTTKYLRALTIGDWLRGARALCGRPRTLMSVARKVLTGSYLRKSSFRLRAHSVLTLLRSVAVAGVAIGESVDLVHADFADDTATAAWAVHELTGRPFSFRDHFSFNPQLLPEKEASASVVLACCEANSQFLRSVQPTSNVVTSYLGIDVDDWVLAEPLGSGTPTVLCVGTLQEKKGQQVLVEACGELRRQGVSLRCVLAGDGPTRSDLEALIDARGLHDDVLIQGYVPQPIVKQLMLEAAIFVLPSVVTTDGDSEGIPVALMEAMALGLTCVSTPTGGIAELITDGVDGLLVPAGDAHTLAARIHWLLSEPDSRTRIGRSARRKVREQFDIRQNGARSAELLRSTHPYEGTTRSIS